MKSYCLKFKLLWLVIMLAFFINLNAYSFDMPKPTVNSSTNVVQSRDSYEKKQFDNPFTISFYEPTYLLPVVYSSSHNEIFHEKNPEKEKPGRLEFNFKLSFKVPVLEKVFNKDNALYLAYSQSSFWQVYCNSAFFRSSDYKPEIFFAMNVDSLLGKDWKLQFINIGAVHESNGYGKPLERSWNRIYVDGVLSRENWMVSVRPWYIIRDHALGLYNPDMGHYLGNGRLLVAYNYHNNVISGEINNLEHGFDLTSVKLTWSFPLIKKIKGFVQLFHGYGQSLIDYNHKKASAAIGIALSDWI